MGVPLVILLFHGMFHERHAAILGYPHLWKSPYINPNNNPRNCPKNIFYHPNNPIETASSTASDPPIHALNSASRFRKAAPKPWPRTPGGTSTMLHFFVLGDIYFLDFGGNTKNFYIYTYCYCCCCCCWAFVTLPQPGPTEVSAVRQLSGRQCARSSKQKTSPPTCCTTKCSPWTPTIVPSKQKSPLFKAWVH